MTATSILEKDVVLHLFKDFTHDYNSNTLSHLLNKSRVGTLKALKAMEEDGILKSKALGKAFFFKVNLAERYSRKNVETLLMEEARKHSRWLEELNKLFDHTHLVILFGSILRSSEAKDIDLLIVYDQKNNEKINKIINDKNQILLKKIHPIKQTREDLKKNIEKQDKVVLNAIKEGIVLHGYETLIEIIEDATS